jgi:hypothetical protein
MPLNPTTHTLNLQLFHLHIKLTSHVEREADVCGGLILEVDQMDTEPRGEEPTDGVNPDAYPPVQIVENPSCSCVSVDTIHRQFNEGFLGSISTNGCWKNGIKFKMWVSEPILRTKPGNSGTEAVMKINEMSRSSRI